MGKLMSSKYGRLAVLILFLAICTGAFIWSAKPFWPLLISAAHAQALVGQDPLTFWNSVVTYGIALGRMFVCVGGFWKGCLMYMGHYDFRQLAMLGGGASLFFGVPTLAGVA
jgi:hypothetical protein